MDFREKRAEMKGAEFKAIRECLGLTQDEMAEVLCLSGKRVVSNIECDVRKPSKLTAVIMMYLDRLPRLRSKEFQKHLKALNEEYDKPARRKPNG